MSKSRIPNARTETGKQKTKIEFSLAHNMDEFSKEEKRTYDAVKAGAGMSKRSNDAEASSSKRMVSGSSPMAQTRSMSTSREDIQGDFNARKRVMRRSEIQEINEHLRGLEAETYLLKQAFLEAIDERKKLIHAVYQQLQRIDGSLLLRSQLAAGNSFYASLDANAFKDLEDRRSRTGTDLSQVLCQVTKPLVLSKKYRITLSSITIPRTPLSNKRSL